MSWSGRQLHLTEDKGDGVAKFVRYSIAEVEARIRNPFDPWLWHNSRLRDRVR